MYVSGFSVPFSEIVRCVCVTSPNPVCVYFISLSVPVIVLVGSFM